MEVSWLLGVGPKRVAEILSTIDSLTPDLLGMDNLPSIAKANLIAARLSRLPDSKLNDIAAWILDLALAFDEINPEQLRTVINDERIVSGFPELTDLSVIETEIKGRRDYYRQVVKSTLDRLPSKVLVATVTTVVDAATDNGEQHGPILIGDLVDTYEVEAQEFLEKGTRNIEILIEELQVALEAKKTDSTLASMVKKIIQVVKNWDMVAQPIQVSAKSRGLDHDASHKVAGIVREMAIDLFNEHGKLDLSQQLTNMLQEVFAEVVGVAERTAKDAVALENIAEESKQSEDAWKDVISIDMDLGSIFTKRFRISPDGIEWKKKLTPLKDITRVRWGGTKTTQYGKVTDTDYSISYGAGNCLYTVNVKNESLYIKISGCLWKAVGVRLMTEFIQGLCEGRVYKFSSALVSDLGIELERKNLFKSNERVFCTWGEVVIWNGPGVFCIQKKEDKKLVAAFSYEVEDNIHVLEGAIQMFWKRGGDRLSILLEGK